MKISLSLLCLCLPLGAFAGTLSVADLNAQLSPGINLGNSLEAPADGSWDAVPATFAMIDEIAACGFASVRFPVRWSDYVSEEAPYTIDAAFLEKVDGLIDRALSHGMKVILNIHHYNEFYEHPVGELQRFLGIWKVLAPHYQHYAREDLIFEILNEPHGNMGQREWQAVYPPALMIIRETNPDRPVIMGGSPWNGYHTLFDLDFPDDPNLIATIHYYNPYLFTHQGAAWNDPVPPTGVRFSASKSELAEMARHFAEVQVWAAEQGVPVNVGEFGAYKEADMDSRVAYTRAVREMADAFGYSWHYWEFASGFGIFDRETGTYREGLRGALMGDD